MANSSTSPLISVIMPVYNGEPYLNQAIESILNQTHKNLELIIVDDKSKDNSAFVIQTYAKQDDRIIFIKNESNQGESGSANIGFTHAKGEYIARMDQDDIAVPERLEKELAFLQANPNHVVVSCQCYVIDEHDKVTGHRLFPLKHSDIYKGFGSFQLLLHPGILVRRSLLPNPEQLWTNRMPSADDYLTFFTLITAAKCANLPEKLLYYRVHSGSNSMLNVKSKFINSLKVRMIAVKELGYPLTLWMILMMIAQSFYVLLLPERISVGTYMTMKGIKPFKQAFFS